MLFIFTFFLFCFVFCKAFDGANPLRASSFSQSVAFLTKFLSFFISHFIAGPLFWLLLTEWSNTTGLLCVNDAVGGDTFLSHFSRLARVWSWCSFGSTEIPCEVSDLNVSVIHNVGMVSSTPPRLHQEQTLLFYTKHHYPLSFFTDVVHIYEMETIFAFK